MAKFIQVLTTVNSKQAANRIAQELLERRIAACVQIIGPINSRYWWKNRIEHATEWLCLAKARASDYRRIEAGIKTIHPYEVPEILTIPVLDGNKDYLRWIERETARTGRLRNRK